MPTGYDNTSAHDPVAGGVAAAGELADLMLFYLVLGWSGQY